MLRPWLRRPRPRHRPVSELLGRERRGRYGSRLARELEPGPGRRRALVSVAITGQPRARVEALALLLAELRAGEAQRADAVRDLLISGLLALDEEARPTPMLSGSQALMSLVFAPDLKPAGGAR